MLPHFLHKTHLIGPSQYRFATYARAKRIDYGDEIKGLPLSNASVDVVCPREALQACVRSPIRLPRKVTGYAQRRLK
jgi:hypothetical protein